MLTVIGGKLEKPVLLDGFALLVTGNVINSSEHYYALNTT